MTRSQSHGEGLSLRPAAEDDVEVLFVLRNDPESVEFSGTARAVTWEEHREWFARCLTGAATSIWIGESNGDVVGQVRVDIDGGSATVSIAVIPERRGCGYAMEMLRHLQLKMAADHPTPELVANVHRDNAASRRLFERSGFVCTDDQSEFQVFRWCGRSVE
ncbi:MAG: GNAT family N-acetyltransferase [Actinobacteria bacterium]|nr:GNAT family N-acetyltransferase [Actinomycetota bacterium]